MSQNKPVALVVGASRGIGRQVAIDLAKNNYAGNPNIQGITYCTIQEQMLTDIYSRPKVVVAAKSTSDAHAPSTLFPPDPNSPQSTISTVEREIRSAGGEATAIAVDVRDLDSIEELVRKTVEVHSTPPPRPHPTGPRGPRTDIPTSATPASTS